MSDNTKTVRIVGNPPLRATEHSAACDLITTEAVLLQPGERRLVKTGIRIALPPDTCAFVLPRSGLALKYGVTVANAPGLIDAVASYMNVSAEKATKWLESEFAAGAA